jgi:uncharacterized membrane protein YjjP (DUF1212 family)
MTAAGQPAAGADEVRFVLKLGSALHDYGCPAYRVEDAMSVASLRFGLAGQFFSTPTAIFAQFGAEEGKAILLRRNEVGTDLTRLARLYELLDEVVDGRMPPREGSLWVDAILAAAPRYSALRNSLAHSVAAAATAVFLGGGPRELVAAGTSGFAIGLLGVASRDRIHLARALELLAGIFAALLAGACSLLFGPLGLLLVTISSLVVLLPGYAFTTAIAEIASRHLASGTARLLGAIVVFLQLAVGVGIGTTALDRLGIEIGLAGAPLPDYARWLAVVVAVLGLEVLLQIPRADLLWVTLTALLGFAATRTGQDLLGPPLGSFAGALCVVLIANLYGRLRRRPSALVSTPTIILLVPGTIGVRSLTTLLGADVISGVQLAFETLLATAALVAGMLSANVLVPPRREA